MAIYRYLFCDLLTNAVLDELPLNNVSFDSRLNEVGALRGTVNLSDPQGMKLQAWLQTPGGRTAVFVDRDSVLLWGGIVVTRRYSEGGSAPQGVGPRMLEIGASELMWWFRNKQVIQVDKVYTNQDQFTIAEDLFNYAQSAPFTNIGMQVPSSTSGVIRPSMVWRGADRKKVGQAVMDLAALDNGFDWQIRVGYGLGGAAAGTPGKLLVLGYPRLGSTVGQNRLIFEYPGNIIDYAWTEDSSQQAVTAFVQGSGVGAAMVQSSNTITALLDAGYPNLQEVFRAKDQTDPAAVAARAVSTARAFSSPVTFIEALISPNTDPPLGSYSIGDDCLVRLTGAQYPSVGGKVGYESGWRIVARRVLPPTNRQAERVYVTFGAIPA